MNSNSDFSNAKVGDLVTSMRHGHGIIIRYTWNTFTILIEFLDEYGDKLKVNYYMNGCITTSCFAPTLFKGHIDVNSLSINYNTI